MRIAFDIGGTFTDVAFALDDGQFVIAKMLSRYDDIGPDMAALIDRSGVGGNVDSFVHATTACSNALIERALPPIGFITTAGHRRLLELMGQRGSPTGDTTHWERQAPLVPYNMSYELSERMLADGSVDRPLKVSDVDNLIAQMRDQDVEVVAVCLLNSYVNNAHELTVRERFAVLWPEMSVCLSSEIDPEVDEYPRASTTVINAALLPIVNNYLDRLQRDLDRFTSIIRIMQSNGGTMSSTVARKRPMTMVESGPAAGVLAAAVTAQLLGVNQVLSFDMGGTTAKVCLVEDGRPVEKPGLEVGRGVGTARLGGDGLPLRSPSLDIVEVGAGGGSIAWIDSTGGLRVGPQSAGADPGPACYGKGGVEPTVTDANVALGFINPEAIADGTLRIDRAAALKAIETYVAVPLGLDIFHAAQGIIDVANATMVRAVRSISTERGRDVRNLTLLAFGGSGPVHATSLCEQVGIDTIIIPPKSGVFSALGLLLANERLDYVQTVELPLEDFQDSIVKALYDETLVRALEDLPPGVGKDDLRTIASIDVRYESEPSELNIPFDCAHSVDHADIVARFEKAHERDYGFIGMGPLRVARLRIQATIPRDHTELREIVAARKSVVEPQSKGAGRLAHFRQDNEERWTPVCRWSEIEDFVTGPLIIEEETTAVVLLPGWKARRDEFDNLLLERISAPDTGVV